MKNIWYKTQEKLPDCHSQHRRIFLSDEVLTFNGSDSFSVARYMKVYIVSKNGGFELIKEGFNDGSEDIYVEQWQPIIWP